MKVSKKDYNEYYLLWGVYEWLVGWTGNTSTEVSDFVRTWGLDNEVSFYVAAKEGVKVDDTLFETKFPKS